MRCFFIVATVLLPLSASAYGQSPFSPCDSEGNILEECVLGRNSANSIASAPESYIPAKDPPDLGVFGSQSLNAAASGTATAGTFSARETDGFHWKRALEESFTLLAIEQAYVVHTDYRWVVCENGTPFNHYWRDYMQSLSAWRHSGWSDGDPNLFGYVGHPIQGALTSYIEIQNDPRSERLEFSNSKAYWRSRLKATLWNAVYSTQWNNGPISEMTVEKYGAKARPPWNQNGSWPCTTKHCYSGVGQIDIVMTPIGGLGWLVGEDWMDKNIARRVEQATSNRFVIDTIRCTFNPIRAGANILHGNRPWFRARDTGGWDTSTQH